MVSVYQLAHDPNTPPKVLIALIDGKNHFVREAVFENPNCPIELKVEYILSS